MTETAKERLYREKLELISDKSMWHMNFKTSTIKMMMKNAKRALELAENLPDSTDKISVEKLQRENEIMKKALTNIKWRTERDELETYYVERNHDIHKDAIDALATLEGGEYE